MLVAILKYQFVILKVVGFNSKKANKSKNYVAQNK